MRTRMLVLVGAAMAMPWIASAQDADVHRAVTRAVWIVVPQIVHEIAIALPFEQVAQDRDYRIEQTSRETRTLPLGNAGSLEVSNLVGEIVVTSSNGRNVTLEIVKRARARTEADAKRGLQEVTIDIDHRGERATVQTRYPERRQLPYSVSVSYTITAPPGTRIVASSTAGNVSIRGITGDVSANSTAGNIEISDGARISLARAIAGNVTLSGIKTDDSLEASSVAGNVLLQQIRARRLVASAVGGNITVRDATCDSAEISSMAGEVDYQGALAKSGRYQLQTHSGQVRFAPTGNVGFVLQGRTFAGQIQTDLAIQLRSLGPRRGPHHSVEGTYGDGSAIVIMTTFSGNLVVTKK